MQTIKVTNGTLYDYGLAEFEPDRRIVEVVDDVKIVKRNNQPFQCLPIYLNDDDALAIVKQKAVSVDLSGSLFVPDDVDESNIVWVLFRGHMSWLMDNNMGYTEWRDFAAENDHLLPINFQVGNRSNTSPDQFLEYLAGGYNCYTKPLAMALSESFGGRVWTRAQGSKNMQFSFDVLSTYNDRDSIAMNETAANVTNFTKTPYHQMVTTRIYHDDRFVRTKDVLHQCSDITNTINVFCYNGRIEAWFLPGKPWSTYLSQIGQIYNQLLFNDTDVDTYTDALNQYLDDAYDYDSDLSQYANNAKVLVDLNDLKNHQYASHGNVFNWFSNLVFPHCTINWYQTNRILVLLTVVTWLINLIVSIRVGYFGAIISEKINPIFMALCLAPLFISIVRYLFLFTNTDVSESLMMARLQFKANFLQWQGAIGLWYVFWNLIGGLLIYQSHFVVNGISITMFWPLLLDWGLWFFPYVAIKKMPKHLQKTYTSFGWITLVISAGLIWVLMEFISY